MNHNLTVGKPAAVLVRFCLPLLGSMLFQQMYNLADSLIVGKFIGENALAAVGNSYEITLVFIAFAFGINVGCSVIVGQFFGAGRYRDLKTAVYTTFVAGAFLCVLLMAAGLFGGSSLLRLINTPQAVFSDSLLYLNIYTLGLPFLFFYNISTGIFSALGDSKTPFLFLALSSSANVIVDILFVSVFHMGVAGVAWATFLCQGVSCTLAVAVVLRRLAQIPAQGESNRFSWQILGIIARVAIPTIFQQCFVSVGNVVVQGVINRFGTAVMAGFSAAFKLNSLVISCFTTLGNGVSNFTAQNLGAGNLSRIKSGMKQGARLAWLLCIPIVSLYFFGASSIVSIFMEQPEGAAMAEGAAFLKIVSPFYFFIATKLVSDGVLRGSGMMRQFMIGTLADMIIRVSLVYVLSSFLGSLGIWLAWPLSFVCGTCLSLYFYSKGIWKESSAA